MGEALLDWYEEVDGSDDNGGEMVFTFHGDHSKTKRKVCLTRATTKAKVHGKKNKKSNAKWSYIVRGWSLTSLNAGSLMPVNPWRMWRTKFDEYVPHIWRT